MKIAAVRKFASESALGELQTVTEGRQKVIGRRRRRTEGDRKVFAASFPSSRVQRTSSHRLQAGSGRRPDGGWKVGSSYRRWCEGGRLRRWG